MRWGDEGERWGGGREEREEEVITDKEHGQRMGERD